MFHLQNIQFSADGQKILSIDDVNLQKEKKVLLLGPSGSGKTTLMQIMAGLRHAQEGHVFFDVPDGKTIDLQNLQGNARDQFRGQHFGFVFQNFHLLRHLSVIDNIQLAQLGAKLPINKDKAIELLEAVNLAGKAKQKTANLSQGEAQRVAIARAVANDPRVIFADEPSSALDNKNTEDIIELLESGANQSGAMLVVATHDHRIKERFKRVIQIDQGRIL